MNFWKTQKGQNTLVGIVMVLVFVLMLALNYLTPMLVDDFQYSFKLRPQISGEEAVSYNLVATERISSFQDIIESQIAHYASWGGRTVVHTLAQLFLWWGRTIFIVANTIAYLIFSWLLFKHATIGITVKYPAIIYIMVNMLIWFFAPVFGQTILWTVGACNYLWGGMIIFGYLLPYRYLLTERRAAKHVLLIPAMFLYGIIAGWCNENTSGMGILLAICFTGIHYIHNKKIPMWTISGIAGAAIGLLLMVGAPGNFARVETMTDHGIFAAVATRLFRAFKIFRGDMLPLFVIVIFALTFLLFSQAPTMNKIVSSLYFFGALACNFAMILSPAYPDRAQFGVFMALAVSGTMTVISLWELPCAKQEIHRLKRAVCTASLVTCAFVFAGSYTLELATAGENWLKYNAREKYILQEKENNNLNITVDSISSTSTRSPFYEIGDTPDANYYGVESIRTLREELKE